MKCMTTYDYLLDLIIKRQGELDMSNIRLSKAVYVDYHALNDYLSSRRRMPADVMFACLAAVGVCVEVKFN